MVTERPLVVYQPDKDAAAAALFSPFDAKAAGAPAGTPTGESLQGADLSGSLSFLRCDAPNVMITTVKQSEDGDDWVVRLYDGRGRRPT